MRHAVLLRRLAGPSLLVLAVTLLTVATASDARLTRAMTASAEQVARGQLWRLITSGMIAERPLAASLVSFALLAGLTFAVCNVRVCWLSALLGHVGSALVVYTAIGLWRLLDPAALRAAWSAADYGVSAVSAAWLGVIAATGWRARGSTWPGRAAIALSCMALSILAYMLRPGISLFASEHVIAFATGAAIAYRYAVRQPVKAIDARSVAAFLTTLQRGARSARWLGRVDPVALAASVVAVSLLVGSTMPSALAALSRSLLDRESPSRCSAPGRGHASLLSCEDRRQLNVRFP